MLTSWRCRGVNHVAMPVESPSVMPLATPTHRAGHRNLQKTPSRHPAVSGTGSSPLTTAFGRSPLLHVQVRVTYERPGRVSPRPCSPVREVPALQLVAEVRPSRASYAGAVLGARSTGRARPSNGPGMRSPSRRGWWTHGLPPQLVNRGRRHAAAASAGPHTSAPRRRVEDRPRRDAGAHRRDLVVTTYAMLTRQPWLADVFILSLKAGGIWWNPAVENQATDRAFRIGQHRNVLVHKFVTSGTIEEKIELMLAEKRQLADELIDGDGEVGLTELPDDELLDLVRLDVTRAAP